MGASMFLPYPAGFLVARGPVPSILPLLNFKSYFPLMGY
jgi:hypothetical protein